MKQRILTIGAIGAIVLSSMFGAATARADWDWGGGGPGGGGDYVDWTPCYYGFC